MPGQTALIEAATRLEGCTSSADRWSCAAGMARDIGSDWVTVGTASRGSGTGLAIRSTTPDSLMRDYMAERLYLDDPWMAHCASNSAIQTTGLDGPPSEGATALGHRQAMLFRDHGIHRAVLVPCYGGPRPGGIVLYARDADAAAWMAAPGGLATIRLATALIAAFCRPEDETSGIAQAYHARAALTAREGEVLAWLSRGLLSAAIAERMGVTPVTVAKHLRSARRKLGARTREQALALAVRDRLIAI